MAQKLVGYTALESFWGKLNRWLLMNFESLFSNCADLEARIAKLEELLNIESSSDTLPSPEEAKENKIYAVPSENPSETNKFDEYIYINGVAEKIGEQTPISSEELAEITSEFSD